MSLYLCRYWKLHHKVKCYRLCEKSFEFTQIAIGPIRLEWNEWV
jgi:hypothetical protein